MRYRVLLLNSDTGESQLSILGFSSLKKARAFAADWKALGEPFDCKIKDTQKGIYIDE